MIQIGLLHSTYTETEIFRGMDTPYQLFVIKSGKGKQETEVSISVDETVLQSYNTDNWNIDPIIAFRLLYHSSACSASQRFRLSKDFDIKWNADRLSDLLSTGKEYGLPIQMSVVQNFISADDERLKTIIVPTIKEPYLQMDVPGMSPVTDFMPTFGDLNERES